LSSHVLLDFTEVLESAIPGTITEKRTTTNHFSWLKDGISREDHQTIA